MGIVSTWRGYAKEEKTFLFCCAAINFLIAFDYSIIRPAAQSLFLSVFSPKFFATAWICSVPLTFLAGCLYNYFLPKIGCFRLCAVCCCTSIVMHSACALFIPTLPQLTFFVYIWKDMAIMLMFQQLWPIIHAKISPSKAHYLYGILFAMTAFGSMCGSCLSGCFATVIGSRHLLFSTLCIYPVLLFFYGKITPFSFFHIKQTSLAQAWKGLLLIKNSSTLKIIGSLVLCMQIASAIVEFQFSSFLAKDLPHVDLRTAFVGQTMGIVHCASLCIQICGAYILLRWIGLKGCHLAVPVILLCNSVLFFFMPVLRMIHFAFATVKIFDFSLFTIIKEILYNPLSLEEKFCAKAFIDIFVYRSSKAWAALCIFLFSSYIDAFYPLILGCWMILVFAHWKKFSCVLKKNILSDTI